MPEQGGISAKGTEWKKQEYVLETQEQYPKKVCFTLFGGDRIAQAGIQAGELITLYFDIESREYQGRWYTNINGWKVERAIENPPQGVVTPANAMPPGAQMAPPAPPAPAFGASEPVDDLPF